MNSLNNVRTTFLCHVLATVRNNDVNSLLNLGLSPDIIDQLLVSPSADLLDLAHADFLDIRVDTDQLRRALDRLRQSHTDETLQAELLRQGTPRSLMRKYYGMSQADIARLRADLGVSAPGGRTPKPPDHVIQQIQTLWTEYGDDPLPERYLTVCRALEGDITIAQIHHVVANED